MTALLILIALELAVLIWRSFLPAYLGEKGKNLATKEDIEDITHKIESVRLQYVADAERLRNDLARTSFEHQTRYAKLHDRRIEAIDGLYRRLVRTVGAFYQLLIDTTGEQGEAAKEKAGQAAEELVAYFGENRLYYDAELIADVNTLESVIREAWVSFVIELREENIPLPQIERQRRLNVWRRARDIVRDEAPKLREQIENRMRHLMEGSG